MTLSTISILYIDDDLDDHLFFKLALEASEIPSKLELAANGKEGIDKIKSAGFQPTHIFLDLSMPIMDGLEFLKERKKNELLKNIPTFVYSTSDRSKDIQKALDLGAEKFFTKPNEIDNIRKIFLETLAI